MKKYIYVGNGMGVPGLPHEISDDEAAKLGVLGILKDAIENGNYAPAPDDSAGKGKTKKGVSNGQ